MVGQHAAPGTVTLLALALLLAGCDRAETAPAPTGQPSTAATVAASASASTTASSSPDASVPIDAAPVEPLVDAAPAPVVLPAVRVANIGMHIGGGPNDDVTKEPIAKSVAPHFDEFKACFALLAVPAKVELGVDLTIEAAGGKAKVTNPRSTAPGTELRDCGVRVFSSIDFLPPKTGKTIVSYSLQFTPQKP
ncbi:MAG: hypothetical protein ABI175_10890 [Polyangiales bacterium]